MQLKQRFVITAILLLINLSVMANKGYTSEVAEGSSIGSAKNPLKISVIPYCAKEGEQAIQNIKPVFDAITKEFEIHFELSYGENHDAVVEAFCDQQIQLALFGTSSYGKIRKKCHHLVEILATEVKGGSSTYYSGIFVRKGNHLNTLKDLTGKSIAFGEQHSTSGFNFPVSMLIKAGINPVNDFEHIFVTGSHSASIEALITGKAIAAGTSFEVWQKAVGAVGKEGSRVDPLYFKPLAKSIPIPKDPLIMNKNLPKTLKENLREAFRVIHVSLDELLDAHGNKIDRYDVDVGEQLYINTIKTLEVVTDEIKKSILEKANQH